MEDIWQPFLNLGFVLACCAIGAVVSFLIKPTLEAVFPGFIRSRIGKIVMPWLTMLLGVLAALIPDVLWGKTFFQRLLVGLFAAAIAVFIYDAAITHLRAKLSRKPAEGEG